jgi:hypothetical protein
MLWVTQIECGKMTGKVAGRMSLARVGRLCRQPCHLHPARRYSVFPLTPRWCVEAAASSNRPAHTLLKESITDPRAAHPNQDPPSICTFASSCCLAFPASMPVSDLSRRHQPPDQRHGRIQPDCLHNALSLNHVFRRVSSSIFGLRSNVFSEAVSN